MTAFLASPVSYLFEADFQVVLWLLLIVRERFVDQKLVLHVDLEYKTKILSVFVELEFFPRLHFHEALRSYESQRPGEVKAKTHQ